MSRPHLLDDSQIDALVGLHPLWVRNDDRLERIFEFADFSEAFGFMCRVAMIAEKLDHHPEWSNVWNRVEMAITTHDAGGISELDADFVERVDALLTHE